MGSFEFVKIYFYYSEMVINGKLINYQMKLLSDFNLDFRKYLLEFIIVFFIFVIFIIFSYNINYIES